MATRVFNTLTRRKEDLAPLHPGEVRMYVCGVTVYDLSHIGHGRSGIVFDVMRRYLKHRGYAVKFVKNFTDIDDKIINRARELGEDPAALALRYEARYYEVMDRLNIRRAHVYPHATAEIEKIQELVRALIDKGHAYAAAGDVYFSCASFRGYGKLSKRDAESLLAGARVEVSTIKRDPLDFALWKAAKPGEPSWPSPWGAGRPGWHIECSAMALKHIGETIDIHGGGQDLIFPHHENEIAQSEAATGKPFVRYFLHNGFITVEGGEKMSKSLGNFKTLAELFEHYDPMVLRFFILSTHYRSPLTFTAKKLDDAASGLRRLREGMRRLDELIALPSGGVYAGSADTLPVTVDRPFRDALDMDFNTADAIGRLFREIGLINSIHTSLGVLPDAIKNHLSESRTVLRRIAEDMLGVVLDARETVPLDVATLVEQRQAARKRKDFAESDRLRDAIAALGWSVKDTPQGAVVTRSA